MLKFQQLGALIAHAFSQYADAAACDDTSSSLTYAGLAQKVETITSQVSDHTASKGVCIGLCTTKTTHALAALLSVLATGCCVVPIDRLSPVARKCHIIKDARLSGLIADKPCVDQLVEGGVPLSFMPLKGTDLYYVSFHDVVVSEASGLAYILYTSGSTGSPKGVKISHENALSFIQWAAEEFCFSAKDVFASVAPFHFDLSIFDLFVSMWHGGRVILFSDPIIRNPMMLSQMIAQKGITVWYSTPTVMILMTKYGKMHRYDHASLRQVFYAGEVFPLQHLMALKERWPQAVFYNFYGPTETNVCTWRQVPQVVDQRFDTSDIGAACAHVQCKVMISGEVIDPCYGQEGELAVSGPAVSQGYVGRVSDNYIEDHEGRCWYKTGDWVSVLEGGNFQFLGRNDRMVKRRGYRIELDDIQAAIDKHPLVVRAGVVAKGEGENLMIEAFFESEKTEAELVEIQTFVAGYIPGYMLPDRWEQVGLLPMTSTHKIDYQALLKRASIVKE